jgi:hypothetical protein
LLPGEVLMQKTTVKKCRAAFIILLAAALPLLLGGCGGNGSTTPYNITGVWNVTWTPPGDTYAVEFAQSDTALTGSICPTAGVSYSTCPATPVLVSFSSGGVNGLTVNFGFTWSDTYNYTFTGTIESSTTMSGTWSNNNNSSGTWTAAFNP